MAASPDNGRHLGRRGRPSRTWIRTLGSSSATRGWWVVCSCKNIRTSKSWLQVKIEVKGKAHNHKTRALCALRHVVVMGFNTSILACSQL